MTNKSKTVKLGDTLFRTPFGTAGFYVQDVSGKTVAECRSNEIAQAIAKMLNETYG